MTNHCFISYSTADALEFARKLADELQGGEDTFFKTWLDKRDIDPARDWDDQIVDGIRASKCMLFVMTKDSTAHGSMCKNEWNWALKYKKPVVPLRLHKDVDQPFGLGNRQWIDFTGDFEHGLSKLRLFLRELDSPKGVLQALKDRHADADRDLRRASPADQPRIQADIEDLKKQIEVQQKVVDDPKAAEAQTQANIAAGLERERKPQSPITNLQSTKFINPPPGIAQTYFQDRTMETEQVILFLKNDAQRLLTVVGRGGAGKTAMVCRLLKHIENSSLPDDFEQKHGKIGVDGIVYLSETGTRKVNFANLFADLCRLLPADVSARLDELYRNPQTSTDEKTHKLLEAFSAAGRVIVLLDNFENVVDAEARDIADAELDEALKAVLHAPHHPLKFIITTRVTPHQFDLYEPARQRPLPLDTGLAPEFAKEAFLLMDEGGLVGLKGADERLLDLAVERTLGLPRALEALYAALRSDRYTTLAELLALPVLPENVVAAYVGEAFNRLDTNAQKVMQALAVYGRPVTPAAVDYLLAPHLPAINSAPILQRLTNMHFARKESGRFYLHPVDREFAFGLIGDGKLVNRESGIGEPNPQSTNFPNTNLPFNQHALLTRAADYFAQARKPRAEWKKLEDLQAQRDEFDLRCAAGDYDTAASVLTDIDGEYLLLWGYYRMMIQMHEKLQEKITDKTLSMLSVARLGLAYQSIGKIPDFIRCEQKALEIAREKKDRRNEGAWLGNLGNAYADLGDARKAIEFHEQALGIAREIGDRRGEGSHLGNLGNRYADLGDARKAIEFHEQALVIAREIDDRSGEGNHLGNLGGAYADLGDARKAIEFYEQALVIAREIGDRRGEGAILGNLGLAYAALGDARKAIEFHEQALVIAREIGDRRGEGNRLGNLGNAYADLGDARKAIEFHEQALVIDREIGDRRGEGNHLGNLGNRYADLGDARKAIEFYEQALVIAREIGDRRGEGSHLGNLGNRYADLGDARKAIEFYEQALVIAREIGDRGGEGADLSNIAGRYSEIAEYDKAIDYYNQALQNAREIGNKYGESKRLNGLAGVLIEKGDLQNAITHSTESLRIGQEMSSPEVCIESGHTLATALLFAEKLDEALQTVLEAGKLNRENYNHNVSTLHGIILLRMRDLTGFTESLTGGATRGENLSGLAIQAFVRAIGQADEILSKTAEYYDALDAKGLALVGAGLLRQKEESSGSGGLQNEAKVSEERPARTPEFEQAIECFRKARQIAPHAGVVKSVLRLFDELAKCDKDGVLKDVRKAVEGVE